MGPQDAYPKREPKKWRSGPSGGAARLDLLPVSSRKAEANHILLAIAALLPQVADPSLVGDFLGGPTGFTAEPIYGNREARVTPPFRRGSS